MPKVWVAFYWDRSGLVIFTEELACRRYAGAMQMQVDEVELGKDVWEQVIHKQ